MALSWDAPAEDADSVTGYEVLRAVGEGDMATLVDDTGSTATAYTDATATEAGETYAYQVKAIRGEDRSQASGQTQVQVPHDPVDLAPSNLTALIVTRSVVGEEASTTKVVLIWTAPAEDADSVTGYEVLRAVGQGDLATLAADTGSTTNTYTDATATEAGETYAYQVKAIRGEDRSQASGQAQVQLPHDAVDLAPSNLTAEKVDGGINLSWSAPAEDADSVTGYEVLRAVGEDELITLAADTASTDTTYSDTTATDSEETYAYQVKAIRGQARSQGSNKVIEAPEPPATPENLAPSNLTFVIQEDGVELTWDAPAADADSVTGYRVLRRLPNQGENEWLVWTWDTGSTETAYKDGYAQTLGEYYMYRVRALRGDEYSKMSNRVDVRRPEAAPETTAWAPSNLEALVYAEVTLGEEGVTTQVKLTWDAPADGTEWVRGYEVQRATCDGGFATLVSDTGSTGTAYTDADAEAGESYTYRVRARRPQGKSLWSNSWTLLTPGGTGESTPGDCAVPVGAPEPEPVEGEDDLRYLPSMHYTLLVSNTGQTVTGTGQDLNSTITKRAQAFTTGANADGYTLGSIGIMFHTISNTSTAGGQLTVTLRLVSRTTGNPVKTLCTLSDPASFTSSGVQTFDANATCPTLVPNTAYFAVIDRLPVDASTITLDTTNSSSEDAGGAAGWSVGNDRHFRSSSQWQTPTNGPYLIEVNGAVAVTQGRLSAEDFTTLAEGNDRPHGLWSDGTTMWVSQRHNPNLNTGGPSKIFAYDMATKAHKPTEDFNTLVAAGNGVPTGIWSDGTTMFVADEQDRIIYAYDMATKQRDADKEVWEDRVFASGYSSAVFVAGLRHHIGSYTETYSYFTLYSPPHRAAVRAVVLRNERLYLYMSPAFSSSVVVDHHRTDQDFVLEVGDDSFNSADATASIETGSATYSWPADSLTWSSGDEVSVNLRTAPAPEDLTGADLREFLSDLQISPNTLLLSGAMTVGESSQTRLPVGAGGLWSDNSTMWVSITGDTSEVLAYDPETGVRIADEDFTGFHDNNNTQPFGIWADETDMFVADMNDGRVYAYWRNFKLPNSRRDIQLDPLQQASDLGRGPRGIWSDGTTMWVADRGRAEIHAYGLPPVASPLTLIGRLSVERVTDTTAIVAVDLRDLPIARKGSPVSISINRGGATIYAHPDAGTARFMLRGLEPETQYTVSGNFQLRPSYKLGAVIFRTDYTRLAGIQTSNLTHTEATVTVSLAHADVDKRCCIPYWVSRDESEPVYTYYLRHKPSDDNDWSDPVELNFSGSTADTRLTGLDPGTAYDVEVGEDPTFMPPSASVPGYAGTLTVGEDDGGGGILGMDVSGSFGDPYGSISPSEFTVGGTEREIVVLLRHTYAGPAFDQPALYLEFDIGFGGSIVEFTLTVDGTEYHSADASREGFGLGWEWPLPPSWSKDDMVAVAIGFTEAVPFREGTTLEELGAFTTPTMPRTINWEPEMTVDDGTILAGYDSQQGSLSTGNTFDGGGVQYTVSLLGFEKSHSNVGFNFVVKPAIPFDFTLTLGATELLSGDATAVVDSDGNTRYRWAGTTNPNWAALQMVAVELEVPLIDICGRSQAVADAIVAATPSYDFCHMISRLDLYEITELDLTGRTGYGLKAGDFAGLPNLEILDISGYSLGGHNWNQLPVGLFDGLGSLEVLDLSDTNLLNLNRGIFGGLSNLVELDLSDTLLQGNAVPVGVFDGLDSLEILRIANAGYLGRGIKFVDEDIFRGLNTLRELDVGPIRPSDDVLAPLTSLETLNGQDYQ